MTPNPEAKHKKPKRQDHIDVEAIDQPTDRDLQRHVRPEKAGEQDAELGRGQVPLYLQNGRGERKIAPVRVVN
jgi:hypothetical protein